MKIAKVSSADFEAWDVDLSSFLVWAIREQRLYSQETTDMEFNIKLDTCSLRGKYFMCQMLFLRKCMCSDYPDKLIIITY